MEGSHDFGFALSVLRAGWNATGQVIRLQVPDENSKMSLPYLYISTGPNNRAAPNRRVPWLPSQTDLLAEDWSEVE